MRKLYVLLLFITLTSNAQKGYPTPPDAESRLFYIQHSQNHNTFVYDANFLENKKLDEVEPIKIYRIAYTKGGVKEELTKMQRSLAYGVKFKMLKENNYEFTLVSYPEKKLYLEINQKGKPYVKTTVNGKKMILHKMYLSMDKSKSLTPKIEFIDFYGKDTDSGKEIHERFQMKKE